MLKQILVVGLSAGVGVVVGNMLADQAQKVGAVNKVAAAGSAGGTVLRVGSQAASAAVVYGLLHRFV